MKQMFMKLLLLVQGLGSWFLNFYIISFLQQRKQAQISFQVSQIIQLFEIKPTEMCCWHGHQFVSFLAGQCNHLGLYVLMLFTCLISWLGYFWSCWSCCLTSSMLQPLRTLWSWDTCRTPSWPHCLSRKMSNCTTWQMCG